MSNYWTLAEAKHTSSNFLENASIARLFALGMFL